MMTPQSIKQFYHFPGNGTVPPISVEAISRAEAERRYQYIIKNKNAASENVVEKAPEETSADAGEINNKEE